MSGEFATGRGVSGGWQRSETRKVGAGLSAIGFSLLLMGCFLMFNRAMLVLGNIFVIAGLIAVVGPQRAVAFFSRKQKWRGSLSFSIGLLLIFYGRTFIGMVIEVFGILNLFGYVSPCLISTNSP